MKYQIKLLISILTIGILFTGCARRSYDTSDQLVLGISENLPLYSTDSFGENHTVIPDGESLADDNYKDTKAAVLLNDTTQEALVVHNAHDKIYPASMTKLMTGLLVIEAIEDGSLSLDETITLSHTVTFQENNVGASDLTKGCKVTVKNLLYGLLIRSYNDCGVLLAERIAGSEDAFVEKMNERAYELGATNTHFVNCHGLHSYDHYTTAYDLYLIFKEVAKHNEFFNIAGRSSSRIEYLGSKGEQKIYDMASTNQYIAGTYTLPSQVYMIGGKTGTTTQAGSCLILLTKNKDGEEFISVVLKGVTKSALYHTMTDILSKEN